VPCRKTSNIVSMLKTLAPFVVLLVALGPRLYSLNAFITWDEPMWVYRSIKFLTALSQGHFDGTFLVGHPGVITMICGSLGIAVRRFVLGYGAVDIHWLSALPTLDPWDVETLRSLALFLPAAKLPMAVLNAACVVAIYLLVKQLFGTKAAFFAAILIALDPFHLALSRVLHIDAATANFMILSLLALLGSLPDARRGQVVLSGLLAGLAFLTKSYSLFLAPFIALILGVHFLVRHRAIHRAIVSFGWWCLGATFTLFLLWPAMWVDPVSTIRGVLGAAFGYTTDLSATSRFFLGKVSEAPGILFYPVALAFRTTPLVWLGVLAMLAYGAEVMRRKSAYWKNLLQYLVSAHPFAIIVLIVYAFLFTALMGLATKKFDRYMLPVIVAFDVVAAVALVRWMDRLGRPVAALLLSGALIAQSMFILSYHPYYLAYYNPLAGGSSLTPKVMPLGWGEGMDLAADYLNQKEDVQELAVATGGIPGFAPLFSGWVEPFSERSLATTDYALLYISDMQQGSPLVQQFVGQEPEHVLHVHGIDYVWVYSNAENTEVVSYLRDRIGPHDAVLMDALSPLQKQYPDAYLIVDAQNETAVRAVLEDIATDYERLWYIAYPESDPEGRINYQLSTHALLLERKTFTWITASCYSLPISSAFERAVSPTDLNVNFGGQLRLAGYGLAEDALEYRKGLGVMLLWQTLQEVTKNYALSLRLVDDRGHCWVQKDSWLLNSAGVGTSAWQVGESSELRYLLSVPPGIPPGRYKLNAVVYDVNTLHNLNVLDDIGAIVGTEYTVATIPVTPATFPPDLQDLAIPHHLSFDFAEQIELLGYSLSSEQARPGDALEMSLFWRALRPMQQDYALLITLQDETGHAWMETTSPLPNEFYPTSRWQPGEILQVCCDLPIDAALETGSYRLFINLVGMDGQKVVQERLSIAKLSIESREHLFVPPDIRYPMPAQIGESVRLVGYDLDENTVEPGANLRLTLYWQPLARIRKSYTVFAHLLDSENRIWGQLDSEPCNGACPTTSWLEGEFIADEYIIPVDSCAPAGEYQLGVGMYDPTIMQRLPARDGMGTPWSGDRIVLPVRIAVVHAGN